MRQEACVYIQLLLCTILCIVLFQHRLAGHNQNVEHHAQDVMCQSASGKLNNGRDLVATLIAAYLQRHLKPFWQDKHRVLR